LLIGSSDLPGGIERAVRLSASASERVIATLFGLAPCGVLPATDVTAGAVRSYRTFSPLLAFVLRTSAEQAHAVRMLRPRRACPAEAPKARRRAVYFLCH